MSLKPGEDIGEEVHKDRDQFFSIEKGKGEVLIDGKRSKIKGDDAVLVPAGARHNIINTGEKPLRLTRFTALPNTGMEPCSDQGRRPTHERAFRRQSREAADAEAYGPDECPLLRLADTPIDRQSCFRA